MEDFSVELDATEFLNKMNLMIPKVEKAAKQSANDVVDELIRISSDIAPIDKGILHKSHSREVKVSGGNVEAKVEYHVKEGSFNYALWIHEGIYNHGAGTMARTGTTGWSGKHYYAGRKYLERPLKGEEKAFYEHIAKAIKKATGAT